MYIYVCMYVYIYHIYDIHIIYIYTHTPLLPRPTQRPRSFGNSGSRYSAHPLDVQKPVCIH